MKGSAEDEQDQRIMCAMVSTREATLYAATTSWPWLASRRVITSMEIGMTRPLAMAGPPTCMIEAQDSKSPCRSHFIMPTLTSSTIYSATLDRREIT